MTFAEKAFKFVGKELKSLALSQVRSVAKKKATSVISKFLSKSEEEIHDEATNLLGYETQHYTIKNNEPVFKSSPIFVHEWLTNAPHLVGKIIKDEETDAVYYDGEPLKHDEKNGLIKQFIEVTQITSPSLNGHFDKALQLLSPSDFNSFLFKKTFSGWKEGNESVIDTWLQKCFGNALATDPALANVLFRKWIVGTARRALEPGASLDGALTFSGPSGVGKSQFFRRLVPPPFEKRTGEIYCDVKSPRQLTEAIIGKTIANFDELAMLEDPSVLETVKMLLSAQNIDVRLAYKREPQRYALRQGFGATTNQTKFIIDPNMSRRLWVIELNNSQKLDFDFLDENRDKLWQEAIFCAQRGDAVYLLSEEEALVKENNKKYLVEK